MSKREKYLWCCLIFIVGIGVICGWNKLVELINIVIDWIKILLNSFNIVTISLSGDGLITTLFSSLVVYGLVGMVFYFIPLRGRIGSVFGKVCYWLLGGVVGTILNYINNIIFN